MCSLVGLNVIDLQRIRIGNLKLNDLKVGEWKMVKNDSRKDLLNISKEENKKTRKKVRQRVDSTKPRLHKKILNGKRKTFHQDIVLSNLNKRLQGIDNKQPYVTLKNLGDRELGTEKSQLLSQLET